MSRFAELGQRVATVQDADRQRLQLTERVAQSFISELRRKPRPVRVPMLLVAALVGVASVTTLVVVNRLPTPATLPVASSIAVGRRIVAPKDHSIPLTFSDGSKLVLTSGTQASVQELTNQGARIAVDHGKAEVSVFHRAQTHFELHAGPYQVAVTGTKFDLEWLPERDRFELWLKEGSVVVTTDGSSHAAVRMAAAERLVIDHGAWHLSPAKDSPEANLPPSPANVPSTPTLAQPLASADETTLPLPRGSATATLPNATSSSPPDWQKLGKLGKYSLAYANAEELNIATLSQSQPAPSLLTLAEICRFSGHGSEAMLVLTKLRQRFTQTDEAAIAAFQLGRLSSNGQQAATWFQSYLRERPNGTLAREASGRLLEALTRAGDRAGATVAARSYLERYPLGPHAAFATRLLGS